MSSKEIKYPIHSRKKKTIWSGGINKITLFVIIPVVCIFIGMSIVTFIAGKPFTGRILFLFGLFFLFYYKIFPWIWEHSGSIKLLDEGIEYRNPNRFFSSKVFIKYTEIG